MIFWTFFLKIIAIAATLTDSEELVYSKSDSANPEDADTAERIRQDDWGLC
jgi:hypothetical protein